MQECGFHTLTRCLTMFPTPRNICCVCSSLMSLLVTVGSSQNICIKKQSPCLLSFGLVGWLTALRCRDTEAGTFGSLGLQDPASMFAPRMGDLNDKLTLLFKPQPHGDSPHLRGPGMWHEHAPSAANPTEALTTH